MLIWLPLLNEIDEHLRKGRISTNKSKNCEELALLRKTVVNCIAPVCNTERLFQHFLKKPAQILHHNVL